MEKASGTEQVDIQPTSLVGVMSGTSLDGLDLALCSFSADNGKYGFTIAKAATIEYPDIWKQRLSSINEGIAEKYFAMNALYGKFIAEKINEFLGSATNLPIAIASHGHTVFHQPQAGFSTQIGCGATIAANTGITTICDFRSTDVANGGQGAPLVPIGDRLLFSRYSACLNIGGISNISFERAGERIAYDIGVANMLLNYLAGQDNKKFDEGGAIARTGKVDEQLLNHLAAHEYYSREGARSLGREWFEKNMRPHFDNSSLKLNDQLATATNLAATVIADELNKHRLQNVLVTGGGAFNDFLIEQIRSRTSCEVIIPDRDLVNFKEALIFAFLGYLRLNLIPNSLASVTGARRDSIGGAIYLG